MSISDFEQSLWELALLINPTHLANITTSKLNSYYQDTILDMRKVVLVQNLFNDIYNNWTDHQIRYQQNRRRQIENGEITEQQLLEEESEENESEIEYISDEDNQEMMDEERYDSIEFSTKQEQISVPVVEEENKENINSSNNNGGVIIANDNTVLTLPVRKSSVSHKTNGKPIKQNVAEDNNKKIEQSTPMTKTNSKDTTIDKNTNINKSDSKINNNQIPMREMSKKSSKNVGMDNIKEQKSHEIKENVKQITLDFSGKDSMSSEHNNKKANEIASNEKEHKKSKEHRRKKIEREPRKDSLKANVKLLDEKSNEVFKELQKSGVIPVEKDEKFYMKSPNLDSSMSLDEKTESSINSLSSSNTSNNNSFVIRSFNIPVQNSISSTPSTAPSSPQLKAPLNTNKPLPIKQEPIPVRKSSNIKKSKPTYKLSDEEISIKDKYKLNKSSKNKDKNVSINNDAKNKKPLPEQPKVHLRPKKITNNDPGMPPTMQRRSMDELLFQFADVMDIVSLIPHIVGDDDLLGNDLTFNSSSLNSKAQTKDKDGNIIEEPVRRRPSRAPTPPPTVVSNGKEYEIYSIPSERHQKYIKKKEEMEKKNKRRSSLKFEYHGFEDLKRQQELAGYDVTGDIPITEKIEREKRMASNNSKSNKKNTSSSSNNSSSSSCGSSMKMDVLSGCMSSNSSSSSSSHSKNSSSKRASRFLNSLTKSKSKSGSKEKDKDKEKDKSNSNKENVSSNKNYLVRRKSTEKSSSRHQRHKHGNNQDPTSPQPSPTLSSNSSMNTSSSSVKKSYSSTTLSKYDLPHMSSITNDGSNRHFGDNSNGKSSLTTSKSSPGLYEINLLTSSSSNSLSKQPRKKATDNKSSSTSEIDKFFDNIFKINWSL